MSEPEQPVAAFAEEYMPAWSGVNFHNFESFVLGLVCEWPLIARASHIQLSRVNKKSYSAKPFSFDAAKVLPIFGTD